MKKDYSYILFDLDGTLTDSGPGILNGFAYAIQNMGGTVPEAEELRKFVGPPLKDSFALSLGYSPEDTEKAIGLYRKYYNELGGAFENSVYPGIEALLFALRSAGKTLLVATSKNLPATERVLEHFELRKYFHFVAASDDQTRPHKIDVIRYALEQCKITDLTKAVMVGDRENDILAAKALGMDSIGVLYGYGDKKELTTAGADRLAESPMALEQLLL